MKRLEVHIVGEGYKVKYHRIFRSSFPQLELYEEIEVNRNRGGQKKSLGDLMLLF